MKDEREARGTILLTALNYRLNPHSEHGDKIFTLGKDEILLHFHSSSRILFGHGVPDKLGLRPIQTVVLGSDEDNTMLFADERPIVEIVLNHFFEKKIIKVFQVKKCRDCEDGVGILFTVLNWNGIYNLAMEWAYDKEDGDFYDPDKQSEDVKKAIQEKYVEYGSGKFNFSYDDLPSGKRQHIKLFSSLVQLEKEGLISINRKFPEKLFNFKSVTDTAAAISITLTDALLKILDKRNIFKEQLLRSVEKIELVLNSGDKKRCKVVVNEGYEKIFSVGLKGRWKNLLQIAKVAKSGAYDDDGGEFLDAKKYKYVMDYFNSTRDCPLYTNTGLETTKVLRVDDNGFIEPAIRIEVITQKQFELRKNKGLKSA